MNQETRTLRLAPSQVLSNIFILAGLFLLCSSLLSMMAVIGLMLWFNIEASSQAISDFLSIDFLREQAYGRNVLFYIQGMSALGGFFLSSWLFIRFFGRSAFSSLNDRKNILPSAILLTVVLTLVVMPITSTLIEWNKALDFPKAMDSFERWALVKEQDLEELTIFLTSFSGIGEMFLGLLVMAVIPAVGEEVLFRGLLQRNLQHIVSAHAAIWLTALIFSSVHLQFYGFIPRMLLGALFGYLYYWSGNIWIPILAHFVNNGFTLLMIYFYNIGLTGIHIDSAKSMPIGYVFMSALLSLVLVYQFRKIHQSQNFIRNKSA